MIWIDASESAAVPAHGPVHNHSVESICTAVGTFFLVQKGKSYSDPHILIVKDYLDSDRMRVQSIPLSLVKSIEVFRQENNKKRLLMLEKRRKQVIHFSDGSVKYIGGFQEA